MASKMNAGFMAMIAKKKGAPAKKMAGGGMPMKDDKGKPTRKAAALARWKC